LWLKYHQLIYENQPEERGPDLFTNGYLIKLAASLNVRTSSFKECVNSGKYLPWVDYVENNGSDLGIDSTPTVLINGHEIHRGIAYINNKSFIEVLKQAGIDI
jgi:protein-disulfide isomerase